MEAGLPTFCWPNAKGARTLMVAVACALALLVSLLGAARASAIAKELTFPPGDIYVTDPSAYGPGVFGNSGGVIHVNPTDGTRTTVSENANPAGDFPEFVDPFGLALESDGNILVTGAFNGTAGNVRQGLIRVDVDTGARSWVSRNSSPGPGYCLPLGVAVESSGDALVTDACSGGGSNAGRLLRIDVATGTVTELSTNTSPVGNPQLIDPWAVSIDENGQIVVSDTNAFGAGLTLPGGLIGVDPVLGTRSTISENNLPPGGQNFENPAGLPLEIFGDIEVSDLGPSTAGGTGQGAVISVSVDPATFGERTLVSDSNFPVNPPPIEEPNDLDTSQGDILVADAESPSPTGGVIVVDSTPGTIRTVLSENGNPSGPPDFVDPFGIAVVRTSLASLFAVPRDGLVPVNHRNDRRALRGPIGGLRYVVFEPARVRIEIQRRVSGRAVDGECRTKGGGRARGGGCVFYQSVGSYSDAAKRGRNLTPVPSRVEGKSLTPGLYRAVVVATGKTNSSIPASVGFRVVQPS